MKLNELILTKAEYWVNEEKKKSHSVVGDLVKYIENGKLREPQKEAIKVYLWLKFVGNNQKLSRIITQGLLYDDEQAKTYNNYYTFEGNFITQFLNQFAQDNGLIMLEKKLISDPKGIGTKWDDFLEALLHNYEYPNYLYSLPMGAGKTYLMACFIYLDLYFSRLFKNDKRFARNFVIFAPQSTKTAILPSLQTINNFDPKWILPEIEAKKVRQDIKIELLDILSSERKDKLQGNNPNLEIVNRLSQTTDYGLVFITNAEKVVLERYSDKDKLITDPNSLIYDSQKASEVVKTNELREKMSQIPFLGVILDEVHHTYGNTEKGEKRLRTAVNILDQHKNIVSVVGMSGTPYVKNNIMINGEEIKLNQIQDIVYNYPLDQGIGNFLKVPDIRKREVKESIFIKEVLDEFFKDYDIVYQNGTKSKIAFYCPSIQKLNDEILPVVQKWYQENRPGNENEIFRYYAAPNKKEKRYALPKNSHAIFNNLDKDYSDKRVILLVAIGTEGWDCKSLTAVALPRRETSKNFVLQTTCRCLREMNDAKKEKALIYLGDGNFETLKDQLNENYKLSISDLKSKMGETIKVQLRKPHLATLEYKQVSTKYAIVKRKFTDVNEVFRNFDINDIKQHNQYDTGLTRAKIGEASLTHIVRTEQKIQGEFEYSFIDFLYDLAKATYGKYSEAELLSQYEKELSQIYSKIESEKNWFLANPHFEVENIPRLLAASLMTEVEYKSETITNEMEIELLEWNIPAPLMNLTNTSGILYKFMPYINQKDIRVYIKHPEDLDEERAKIDPNDISFNYMPYRMDSDFERIALEVMLALDELSGLEVYFNGFKDSCLQSFWIQTPDGVYTPDFLILKKEENRILKVLILETKAKIYYDDEFKRKEKFMKEVFIKYNPNFKYECFVDEEGKNDFDKHILHLQEMLRGL